MSNGPTLIYDKSFIQSLNPAEARWLNHHFRGVLTPIFLLEVIGDLKKETKRGRKPEDVVAGLAGKVSSLGTLPNVDHRELVIGNLLGEEIRMKGVPLVGGGRPVATATGERGVYFDESPEAAALRRWREGDFSGMEHELAEQWRFAVEEIDLEAAFQELKWAKVVLSDIQSLDQLAQISIRIAKSKGQNYRQLMTVLELLEIPANLHKRILTTWRNRGQPPLAQYAHYAAYVLAVEIFFHLGIGTELILRGKQHKSRIDIAYLYYLPFCMVFVSRDHIHRDTAKLFMATDQVFVDGDKLKDDLAELGKYYDALPQEVKETGAINYARWPPVDRKSLVGHVYDRVFPGWRATAKEPTTAPTPEENAATMKRLKPFMDAMRADLKRRQERNR